ncbi:LacI family DNA-binding transcriptional regulator [Cohnella sp. GCM10027633]|uniref:LacI family DNA-binding transcriptional regulator n=1 Tax=unclassified Cohnella TaxID=2636738 RepID=UPI0036423C48
MKVTINDIARAANVAKSTVSKVLNDAPTIPEETKRRVRAIMKELNYTPSSIATQLARQSSFAIGFIMDVDHKDDFLNPFVYSMVGGAESVVCKQGYEMTISNVSSRDDDDFIARYVQSKKLDGMLLHTTVLTKRRAEQLNELNFPYVVVGQPKEDVDVTFVDIDNHLGGRMAASHLLEQGYGRIAFIGGVPGEAISHNRLLGYRSVMESLNASNDDLYVRLGSADEESGRRHMLALLELPEPPDAVICVNNYVAFGALQAASERKLSIPRDLGIVAFDNYPLAPFTTPSLTAIDNDTFDLGVLASRVLFEKIGQAPVQSSYKLEPRLISRDSTRRQDARQPE